MEAFRTSRERSRMLATFALVCLLLNIAILFLAPIARPDLDVLQRSLSYYAVGPWAIVQNLAFASIGLASLALGIALLQAPGRSWQITSSLALLVGGLGSIALVIFPIDAAGPSTFLGDTHQTAGTIGGVAQLVATLAMAMAARTDARWDTLWIPALTALVLSLAGAIATQASIWWMDLGIPRGITMRLVVAPLVLFWCLVALRLLRKNVHT
jgi:hypothetical protein